MAHSGSTLWDGQSWSLFVAMDPWAAYEHVQRLDRVCEIVLKSGVGVRAMNSRLASATAVESGMGMKGTSSGDIKCRRGRRLNMCMVLPIPTSGDLSGVVKIKIGD